MDRLLDRRHVAVESRPGTQARPLRIAMFVDGFLPVTETFIVRQITGLQTRGHAVDVFASRPVDPKDLNQDAVRAGLLDRVRYYRGPRSFRQRALDGLRLAAAAGRRKQLAFAATLNVLKYRRAALSLDLLYAAATVQAHARHGEYDVIHCQFGPLGVLAMRLRGIGILSGRLVTAFRGYDATAHLRAHPWSYRQLFRAGDLFCPVSASLKTRIVAAGCPEEKVVVLGSGIDVGRFAWAPRQPVSGGPMRLVTVARLVEKKGVADALEAVGRLVQRGTNVTYTIAGDGPLRPRLERRIEELGLSARVRLLGWVDGERIPGLLAEAHVVVAPSITAPDGDQEGIPNVLKEAMASGMPVVSTRHSGIPELVDDGVSGFLVAEGDVPALTDRLAYLADHVEIWPAMGRAGRTKVEEQFDIERLNDRLVELYYNLLRDGTAASRQDRRAALVQ
jgi:colanic acid/amylovoran biosynthesis glycosyltransferase